MSCYRYHIDKRLSLAVSTNCYSIEAFATCSFVIAIWLVCLVPWRLVRLSWAVNSLDVALFRILDRWRKFAALAHLRYPVSYGSQKNLVLIF